MNCQLKEIIEEVLETPMSEIDESSPLSDYPVWDSLKHVQLVIGIQNAFSIELEREDIQLMVSVGAIVGILRKRGIETTEG